jgi:hypothetical protein
LPVYDTTLARADDPLRSNVIPVTNVSPVPHVQGMVGQFKCARPLPTPKEPTMNERDVKTIEADCELSLEELEAVAGGLNPQPLPPLWLGLGSGIHFLNPQPLPPG